MYENVQSIEHMHVTHFQLRDVRTKTFQPFASNIISAFQIARRAMASLQLFFLLLVAIDAVQASSSCQAPRRIIDISHTYRADVPKWNTTTGLGQLTSLVSSMAKGDFANVSDLKFQMVHSGTHVDAPGHYIQAYYEAGLDVASLNLDDMIGPVLLIDAPRNSNLTAKVLRNMHIPKGTERLIFRTLNSDRRLMWTKEWDSSYVGITTDGADWLVKNTNVKFVGIDYLAIAAYDDLVDAHVIILGKKIVVVEGLNLDGVKMGHYTVHCLPLKLLQAEGCPIRCVLSS